MRAPPLLLLLLMAGAGLAATPLVALNPWLSACDLDDADGANQCGSACGGGNSTLEVRNVTWLCQQPNEDRRRLLHEMRLRTCCERSPWSALDTPAREHVRSGGRRCRDTLHALVDLDALVARVHCDFREVVTRYDCNQTYSVHSCDQCQDTYRKWACSTLVPWWLEREDSGGRSRRAPAEHWSRFRARHLERVGHLDRRRGWTGALARWVRAAAVGPGRPARAVAPVVRIKPCLSTCQLVEQHCPYFLPADRAPAYPTQYAGEPTFLCLDERIPETGGQAERSNYGREDCCYHYTGNESNPLNHNCSLDLKEPVRPAAETCQPTPSREPNCPLSRAAPRSPSAILLSLLTLAVHLRTFWTASELVNVRDSRL